MAYDVNDAKDKKIVEDAVAAALAEAEEQYEVEVVGLKSKVTELRSKLAKARTSEGSTEDQSKEIDRLETELSEATSNLNKIKKDLEKTQKENVTLKAENATAIKRADDLLIDTRLTAELVAANVPPVYMDGAKALLARQVSLTGEGDDRKAIVGDKSLGDFVKTWAQGDQGKHYVKAPDNSGGGSNGSGGAQGGAQKKFSEMSELERSTLYRTDPTKYQQLKDAEKAAA